MAGVVLERGSRPELREMARDVVTAQGQEIDQMKRWRIAWFGSAETPAQMSHAMPGMDLAAVAGASDVDRAFIGQMILHHEGAIEMANPATARAEHAEICALASQIASAQRAEITQMNAWREAWYG